MFAQRATIYPAVGKEQEARVAAVEFVNERQARGFRTSLSTPFFGSESGTLVITALFNDLAELEARRRDNIASKEFQKWIAKTSSLSRQATKLELFEVLVPFQSQQP